MKITAAADVGALTVLLADGSASGTLAAGGETVAFEAGDTVMVSCGKSVTLTFTPDSGSTGRILVRSICAGVQMALTEENITACTVTLRSDLSLDKPHLEGERDRISGVLAIRHRGAPEHPE